MTTGSYEVSAAHRDRDSEGRTPSSPSPPRVGQEAAALERLGFRDGMSILGLGGGPGFVTKLILDHFPAATVTAVELDAGLTSDARQNLAKEAGRVTFVHASVDDSGLSGDAHDAAYALSVSASARSCERHVGSHSCPSAGGGFSHLRHR